MADATLRVLKQWHRRYFHPHLHRPVPKNKIDTLYAYQLGVVTAAHAAHGTTNKWQGLSVIPLANNDEVHAVWITPPDFDYKWPIRIRWGLIANAASKASALTTTVDFVDIGSDHFGSDTAGDGSTALNETIATISTSTNPGADVPFFSVWGKANAQTSDWDALFVKLVSSGNTTADAMRVWCMQVSYVPLTA